MFISGEVTFISANQGISKKTGKPYYAAKVHDPQAEEYATIFTSEELFHEFEQIPTHTPVILNLNLSLNSRFFRLESIEIIATH